MKRQMSEGLRNILRKNKEIYEITLIELGEKKKIGELSYPESIDTNMQFKINYRVSISLLKDVLKRINRILRLSPAKDSGLVKERERLLKEHLIILKELRKKFGEMK